MFERFSKWLLSSMDNNTIGASARKLSAFWGIVFVATFISYKHSSDANAPTLITIWLLFALLCLGLVTMEQIIKLKNDNAKN